MACVIRYDGEIKKIEPKNGKDFKWEELRDIIGGYIELVRLDDGRILAVDEDGISKSLVVNVVASLVAGYTIVGDVVLCDNYQIK